MSRIRTFIAVEVGAEIVRQATALQTRLARSDAAVKWVSPHQLHITLLFLGDVEERHLISLCRVVEEQAAAVPEFTLEIQGLGAFPSLRRPKVLWVGVRQGADQLRELHQRIEEPLTESGLYRPEDREYTPHLTLGRLRQEPHGRFFASEIAREIDVHLGRVSVTDVVVMSSELRREGPEYALLSRARLGRKK